MSRFFFNFYGYEIFELIFETSLAQTLICGDQIAHQFEELWMPGETSNSKLLKEPQMIFTHIKFHNSVSRDFKVNES